MHTLTEKHNSEKEGKCAEKMLMLGNRQHSHPPYGSTRRDLEHHLFLHERDDLVLLRTVEIREGRWWRRQWDVMCWCPPSEYTSSVGGAMLLALDQKISFMSFAVTFRLLVVNQLVHHRMSITSCSEPKTEKIVWTSISWRMVGMRHADLDNRCTVSVPLKNINVY